MSGDVLAVLLEAPHPSLFIQEEMDARGWDRDYLAHRMGGDFAVNRLAIDFYFEIGPQEPALRIGSGEDFAKAFGISAAFLLNLEWAWLRARAEAAPHGQGGERG